MTKLYTTILLLCATSLGLLCALSLSRRRDDAPASWIGSHSQGELWLEKESFEVPAGMQGDRITSEPIVLHNGGKEELRIEAIKPGCGCTVIGVVTPCSIEPGGTLSFTCAVDTTTLSGQVRIPIVIDSNARGPGGSEVYLSGNVKPSIEVRPPVIKLHDGNVGEDSAFHIDVKTYRDELHGMVEVNTMPDGIVLLRKEHGEGDETRFVFGVQSQDNVVSIDSVIEFEAHNGVTAKSRASIICRLFRECVVDPYPLMCGAMERGMKKEHKVVLRFRQPSEGVRIDSVSRVVHDAIVTRESDRVYTMDVGIMGTTDGILRDEFVELRYDWAAGGVGKIRVPVVGAVYSAGGTGASVRR